MAELAAYAVRQAMSRSLLRKRQLAKLWTLLAGRGPFRETRPRGVILLYHSVGTSIFAPSIDQFEGQMRYLSDHAEVLSLEALLEGGWRRRQVRLACVLTFDDGYAGLYEHAYPILHRYGFSALAYITTEAIGKRAAQPSDSYCGLYPNERTLTWNQLREMSGTGIEVGSHLCQHRDLTQALQPAAIAELKMSKQTIEQRLGASCRHFAYPAGRFNIDTERWVQCSGYESAVTMLYGTVDNTVERFRIPRVPIQPVYELADFKAILNGDWDYMVFLEKLRGYWATTGSLA